MQKVKPMTMLERAANAVLDTRLVQNLNFPDDYKKIARAVILAMRDPTDEMQDLYPPGADKKEFMDSYRAMIDAALSRT